MRKKTCHFLTLDGETKTLAEWAEQTGINANTLNKRLQYGWEPERALRTPTRKRKPNVRRRTISFNGEAHTVGEWACLVGVSEDVLRHRLYAGWSLERALGYSAS